MESVTKEHNKAEYSFPRLMRLVNSKIVIILVNGDYSGTVVYTEARQYKLAHYYEDIDPNNLIEDNGKVQLKN